MPKTITIKPIEAQLTRNVSNYGNMNPYCEIITKGKKHQTHICKKGGMNPTWEETLNIKGLTENFFYIQVKDWSSLKSHELIGTAKINIDEIEFEDEVTKWFDLQYKGAVSGQILVEIFVTEDINARLFESLQPTTLLRKQSENLTFTRLGFEKFLPTSHKSVDDLDIAYTSTNHKEDEIPHA